MKILLWVLIAFAVVMWLSHSKKQRVKASRSNPPPSSDAPEAIVRCAHCGTYVPSSESVSMPSGMTFCCEEHRAAHRHSGST